MSKDEPANEVLYSKFGAALEKVKPVLSDIIEAKIDVKSQNSEGSRTHYDVTATVKTSKTNLSTLHLIGMFSKLLTNCPENLNENYLNMMTNAKEIVYVREMFRKIV